MTFQLRITGWSGGDIDLSDGVICTQSSWSPKIATRRRGQMGGAAYNEVLENIPLYINGGVSNALTKLHNIIEALDQSERWSLGEEVDAIVLEYTPSNTTLSNPLIAVITGAQGAGNLATLAGSFQSQSVNNQFFANLNILRRGLWLEDSEETITSSAAESHNVVTGTFTNTGNTIALPVKVTTVLQSAYDANRESYILASSDISDGITLSDFTGTADVANYASSGAVKENSTWAGGAGTYKTINAYSSVPSGGKTFGFWVSAKTTTANNYLLRVEAETGDNKLYFTQSVPIVSSDQNTAKWYFLGTITTPNGISSAEIQADPVDGSGTLQIDEGAIHKMDGDDWGVSRITSSAGTGGVNVNLDHRYTTNLSAAVTLDTGGNISGWPSFQGSPFVSLTGDGVAACFLTANGNSQDGYWRKPQGVAPDGVDTSLSATRRRGYLSPA